MSLQSAGLPVLASDPAMYFCSTVAALNAFGASGEMAEMQPFGIPP